MSRTHRQGQSLVELALVLPLFLLLISAIIDFGRIFHVWSCLNLQCIEAAREGAKRRHQLLGRNVFTADTHTEPASITQIFFLHQSPAIDATRFRTPGGDHATAPELLGVGTSDRDIIVRIHYSYPFFTPFMSRILSNIWGKSELVISAGATERKE
ncbi:MAG TPA: TadE/TadG family type IV pilus assembly protein [Candidatus Ozemobacteraceae bacterium]|nr:TadE/TadG family type IV pilus assembly protein [Candidatus Ozemobacteraceae bacterium]